MEGGGERKRKAGIELDWSKLLPLDDDEPPPTVVRVASVAEKRKPQTADVMMLGEEDESHSCVYLQNISDGDLKNKIDRAKKMLGQSFTRAKLRDDGKKLQACLRRLEAELERRPKRPTKSFAEELSNPCDSKRANRQFLVQRTHKIGLSSRQAPFKSPNYLPVHTNDSSQSNGEHLGSHSRSPSPSRPDKDFYGFLEKKKENVQRHQPMVNTKRNNMDSSTGKQMVDTTQTDSDTPRLITEEQLRQALAQIETVTKPLLDAVTLADTRERQIHSLREVIACVHQDASTFRSQRDELLEALERMRPEYLELESKVDFLESKLRLKDQTIAQLRGTRFFQRHEIKMLEKQIRSAHRQHEEF